jgi:hypothetical protein
VDGWRWNAREDQRGTFREVEKNQGRVDAMRGKMMEKKQKSRRQIDR